MENNQELIDALEALQDVTVTLRTHQNAKPDIYGDINLEQTLNLRATAFLAAMISSPNATPAELRDVDALAERAVEYAKALQDAEIGTRSPNKQRERFLDKPRARRSEGVKLNAELEELLNEAEGK